MVEYLCIIQARVSSTRLPAKVMLDLAGKTLIQRVYKTVSKSDRIDKIIVATSVKDSDDILAQKLDDLGIEYFRGDLENVLKRFFDVAKKYNAKNIIRITADNPLMDANLIDDLISLFEKEESNYSMFSNGVYGLSAEVFDFNSLEIAYKTTQDKFDQEHVTPYIVKNFKSDIVEIEQKYKKPNIRATIDTLDDYIKMQKFYLYCQKSHINANIDNFIKGKFYEK